MNNYSLVTTLGIGSIAAFAIFFIFAKLFHWSGKMSSLATAALMLLLYVPLAATHWAGLDVFAIHFAFFMMIPYGLGIISGVHEERKQREGVTELKSGMHWIPGIIIVFFILLAVVDSIIITFATKGINGELASLVLPKSISGDAGEGVQSNFTGNVSYDLQDEEERFNQYVMQLKRQKERGWQVQGGWQKPPVLNESSVFQLAVKDKNGQPVSGATVDVSFLRPAEMKADQHYSLQEKQRGVYAETVTLSEPGCWKMQILIKRDKDIHEIRGESEVAEVINGKLVPRECVDGEPDMDTGR